jgi:hypothetical protein
VASLCIQLQRDGGEEQSRDWHGVSVTMFSGFPGYPEELQLANTRILAVS